MKMPVYMDNLATTACDPRVVQAMLPYFTELFGNASSRQHRYGWIAEESVAIARKRISRLIGALEQEIIFTSGATEANNLAIKGITQAYRGRGNHIVTMTTEHSSVLDVCTSLEKSGWHVTYLPPEVDGRLDSNRLLSALTEKTVLVTIMTANNEIGTIQDIETLAAVCRERNIIFHTDAVQAVGKMNLDVGRSGIDLMSISAHKFYGPKGIGALYIRSGNPKVHCIPQIDGGGHERGLRSGTLNVPAIVGFGMAAEITSQEIHTDIERIRAFRDELQNILLSIPGNQVNGSLDQRLPNTINISFSGISADDLILALKNDIAFSTGAACSSGDFQHGKTSHVLREIGVGDAMARGTIRLGLGRFTTEEEVRISGDRIRMAVEELRHSQNSIRHSQAVQSQLHS